MRQGVEGGRRGEVRGGETKEEELGEKIVRRGKVYKDALKMRRDTRSGRNGKGWKNKRLRVETDASNGNYKDYKATKFNNNGMVVWKIKVKEKERERRVTLKKK